MSPEEAELRCRIDEVLHYLWDPIGIADNPQARDEYASYGLGVLALVKAYDDPAPIALRLSEIREKRMELPENREKDRAIAEILLDWREAIVERASESTQV